MTANQAEWARARDDLVNAITSLGYPAEFGDEIAKNLGSPKAIWRMTAYLDKAKPDRVEDVVDEMLAIRAEIENWRSRKESLEANAKYNEMLNDRPFDQ